ncbi:MAG: hypothetical protein OHK005_04020 [Candidatus Methylacidiphilales bacterium]
MQGLKILRVTQPAAWLGWVALVGYLAWNIYWVAHGRLPPSLWQSLSGLPAPTTGMTRSWIALGEGRWMESLAWNPFTIPLTAAWLGSIGWAIVRLARRQPLSAPRWFLPGWLGLLLLAWAAKGFLGPAWW